MDKKKVRHQVFPLVNCARGGRVRIFMARRHHHTRCHAIQAIPLDPGDFAHVPPNTPWNESIHMYNAARYRERAKSATMPRGADSEETRAFELCKHQNTSDYVHTYIRTYNKLIYLWWMQRPPTPHHVLLGRQKWRVGKPQIAYSTSVCTEHVTSGVASVDVKTTT